MALLFWILDLLRKIPIYIKLYICILTTLEMFLSTLVVTIIIQSQDKLLIYDDDSQICALISRYQHL